MTATAARPDQSRNDQPRTDQAGAAEPEDGATWQSIRDYAVLGVRLRWRLSSNRLKRRGRSSRRLTIALATVFTLANVIGLGLARFVTDDFSANTLIVLVSSMSIGWVFGPVLIGGVDETVDPTRLALLPLRDPERYALQLAAALTGVGPLSTASGLFLGLTIGYVGIGVSLVVVPVAALTIVLLLVGLARSLAAMLAIAQRSRAGRDLAVMAAALISGGVFVLAQLARDVITESGSAIVGLLGWLPWAWPANAIIAARDGAGLQAFAWLGAGMAAAAISHVGWVRLSQNLLLNGEQSARARGRRSGAVLSGASTVFGASLARQWIYVRRSPNNRVGLLYGTIFGVAFALVQILRQEGSGDTAAAFGILLAMLANLGATTNVLGFDAGSLWIEVLAGGPSRAHMVARHVIALPNLLLPTWLSGVVIGVLTGAWQVVLLVSLLAVGVAFNVLTFGMITSATSPAPLPDWDNPFGNRQGNESRGLRLILIAIGGMFFTLFASLPSLALALRWLGSAKMWLAPVIGLGLALTIFAVVLGWVGWYLRDREPDLIERLAPRALN